MAKVDTTISITHDGTFTGEQIVNMLNDAVQQAGPTIELHKLRTSIEASSGEIEFVDDDVFEPDDEDEDSEDEDEE